MVTGTFLTSTLAPGCPQAARNSGGIAGRAADVVGGAALAHPATAPAARTRASTAIRFMSDWTRQARARFLVYSGARLAKESDVILVTGATGRVGYHLMELLADAGAEATAMVRVEARGTDLPGTAGHLVASLEAPPPASVLREFDRVFLLSPAEQEQAALETVFIDALVAAGAPPARRQGGRGRLR
jgi:hypothetical protein